MKSFRFYKDLTPKNTPIIPSRTAAPENDMETWKKLTDVRRQIQLVPTTSSSRTPEFSSAGSTPARANSILVQSQPDRLAD